MKLYYSDLMYNPAFVKSTRVNEYSISANHIVIYNNTQVYLITLNDDEGDVTITHEHGETAYSIDETFDVRIFTENT